MKTKLLLLGFLLSVFFASANNATLTLRVFLEGFYSGGTMPNTLYACGPVNCDANHCDYISVYLYDENCNEVQREIGIVDINGYCTVYLGSVLPLRNITLGNYYWLRVTHRNHIDVWSANTIQINASTSYDFTTSASQAFGSNQASLGGGAYGMFAGDLYRDCAVDGSDFLVVDAAVQNGDGGYVVEDVTGDCAVDATDEVLVINNIGAGCASPCNVDPCTAQRRKSPQSKVVENSLEFTVMPNPASDAISVVTNREKCDLKMMNALGEIVYEARIDFQTSIQVSKYPKGIYYVTIERNGIVEGKKKIAIQ